MSEFSQRDVLRTPTEHFYIDKCPKFIDTSGLLPLFKKMAFRADLILSGPKGIAKSLSMQTFAKQEGIPFVRVDCAENMQTFNLFGHYIVSGDSTPFVLGPVPTAFEIANEVGACILCFEEINALSPYVQKALNSPTDFKRSVIVEELQHMFHLEEGSELWITGTMNSSVYGGVYSLNEDLKSRFRFYPLSYPEAAEETEIIQTLIKDVTGHIDSWTLNAFFTLVKETRNSSTWQYELATRDLLQVLEDYIATEGDLHMVLRLLSGKFEEENRKTFASRVNSIFGITL